MKEDNLKIIIAGPGAGKTYSITNEVLRCLPILDSHHNCAVVTYTNAATDEIRARISKEIKIQSNLFIGTIHSFLIRFIFEPFAHLLNICEVEKYYIDKAKLNYRPKNRFAAKNSEISIAETLLKKGIITYDQIISQALKIIEGDNNIQRIITNRLQFVFIDEYQDSRLIMHAIIKCLIKNRNTTFYCIGDPLQSIYNFTYVFSQIKKEPTPKSFIETPMMDFIAHYSENITQTTVNNRSSLSIVCIINQYILKPEYKQTSAIGSTEIPVYFITEHDKEQILRIYSQINTLNDLESIHKRACERTGKPLRKILILTREWNILSEVCIRHGVSELPKNNHKQSNHLAEISRIILGILGLKKSEALLFTKDEISFRKFCFEVLRYIKSSEEKSINPEIIRKSFQKKYSCILPKYSGEIDVIKSLEDLREKKIISNTTSFYSAIHSSKGLESTSVLVCAQTEEELLKWLDFEKANSEKDDDFRLGYVAFSRARDILCIACLKPIVRQETTNILRQMNIRFSDEII